MSSRSGDTPSLATAVVRSRPFLAALLRVALPLGILVSGLVLFVILSLEPDQATLPAAAPQAIRTRVTELRVRDYPVVITTHGVVQPHNAVTLSAQVSGQIAHFSPSFDTGAFFSEGEVLVELDARDYQIALAVAEARELGARSALQLAMLNHERNLKLAQDNLISDTVADQSAATLAQASAEVDSARAQVDRAKHDLERTKIRAPFAGRVRQKTVGLGQIVGPGTPLGAVFAVDFAEVRLPISSRELPFLDLPEQSDDPSLPVELRDAVSNAAEPVWKAKIIRTEGAVDEDSLDLFAVARVEDPFGIKSGQPPLRIGQPVTASIAGKTLTNVVALPRGAVRQLDQVVLVQRTDQTNLTLMPKTIVPVWSDAEHIIVRDPAIVDGTLLATTHLVYAPSGAQVEIIPDIPVDLAVGDTNAPPVTVTGMTNALPDVTVSETNAAARPKPPPGSATGKPS